MGIRSFLSRLRGRGDDEQRLYPPTWLPAALQALLGGGKSHSGITVDENKALTYTVFYSAVDLIARSVAELPLHVYERGAGDVRNKAIAHPNYDLLHTRPNLEQTSFGWRQGMQGWTLTWGNAYAEIERNGAGRAVGLWPIPPNQITIERDKANQLVYRQIDERGQAVGSWSAYDILHVHGLGDGIVGWSPVRLFREAIGLGLAEETHGASFFGNDARPGGVLEHPGKLGDKAIEHLRASWEDRHAGPGNTAKPAILEEGMTWKTVGIPNDDAQFLESRKFQVAEMARVFHIPPHMLGDLDRATFSNIESQGIEWVQYCLGPWLKAWEQELDYKLFTAAERKRYYTKFSVTALLRGDAAARSAYYTGLWNIGAMSQNEIRALEELNPVEGGDQHFVPMNMIPAELAGKQFDKPEPALPDEPAPDDEPDDEPDDDDAARSAAAHRELLVEACGRVVYKEVNALRRAIKKPETFTANLDEFYKDHASFVVHVLRSAVLACAAAIGVSCDGYIKQFADEYAGRAHGRLWGVTESQVPVLLDDWEARAPEQMADRILADLRKHR